MGVYVGGMIILMKILFGPAGYPADAKGRPERVFQILNDVGVTALEYAAVHGLTLKEEKAKVIGELADNHEIAMSMHEAYYISLASKDQKTRERSKQRLIKALRFAPLMRVKRIVFHPGTLGGLSREEAHCVIRDSLRSVWEEAGEAGGGAWLAPEIAGKISMYGSVEQIINLCQDVDGCIPTIDWAHLYARSQGAINDRESYLDILNQFEIELGSLFIDNMHFHISGITFTEKGEGSHRPLGSEWGPDIYPLMELVQEVGYKPTFICESPDPLQGALYAKYLFEEIQRAK
ncbi:deoxyribonuclease IV [Candidatus Thorarchaeota archaeon]|nr:MAG: deoxyribonuclease IV [Candidatus Thorarchaeota archaeon]